MGTEARESDQTQMNKWGGEHIYTKTQKTRSQRKRKQQEQKQKQKQVQAHKTQKALE
jgi:hypothetical protein